MSSRSPDGVLYLTTPIYYINGPPHLGHAYTTIVADTMARYRRLAGADVFFLTGTDEHGDKIAQAAAKAGEPPQALADRNAKAFREQWDALGITYDDFIRTTEPRHARVVHAILQALFDRGEIYLGKYGGHYCFGCERFYTDKEIVDGKCPDHQTPLTYIEEENYFFRMSAYQDWLRRYLEDHPDAVQPERYRNELLGFLREPLQDLSISRPKSRLQWGISLPFDDRFVTYVWFDALLNYVSALGERGGDRFRRYWPHVHHLIGKDILKPHGIYWPCMLKAAGLLRDDGSPDAGPGFARLRVHGYWTLSGGKISKSVGNVVEALALTRKYGNDALRYFVLREMPFGQDANFNEDAFVERLNADLANDLGNLVARATTMVVNFGPAVAGAGPAPEAPDLEIRARAAETSRAVAQAMDEFGFQRALVEIWSFIGGVNRYIDAAQPWALAKDAGKRPRLAAVLVTLADALRYLGIVLEPFLPESAARIRAALGDPRRPALANAVMGRTDQVGSVERLSGLFPRVDTKTPAAASAAEVPAPSAAAGARITFDDFKRVDLRVAEIVAAEPVPKSKKLLKLTVRLADETRTLVAGIAEHYRPDALVGRKVVVVANLEPATLMGVTSNGMVLAGAAGEALALLALDRDLPSGAKVR
ncbi:MAG TPA: methionine--tRNA ligase [Methylomirabilota bacterium]|jgi:methionyl-tRNA synthetase|nr:methionine--tRNA ligase [Methylomirabilota bacterium]